MLDPPAPAPQIEPTSNDPPAAPPPAWQAEVDTQRAHAGMGINFGLRKKKKQRTQRAGFVKHQMGEINKKENLQVALTNVRKGLVCGPNPEALNNSRSPPEACWKDFAKLLACPWIPAGEGGHFVRFCLVLPSFANLTDSLCVFLLQQNEQGMILNLNAQAAIQKCPDATSVEDVGLSMESVKIVFCALHRGGSAMIAKLRKRPGFRGKNDSSTLGDMPILNCCNN
jgi:hypothetical protein